MILNYRTRKQRSSMAVATTSNPNVVPMISMDNKPAADVNGKKQNSEQTKELLGRKISTVYPTKHSKRNIPPGYKPLEQFLVEKEKINLGLLIEISLSIARDIEEKHHDSKIYASLNFDDIYVADSIMGPENAGKLFLFIADYHGYRHKRSHCGPEMFFGINTGNQSNASSPIPPAAHQWRHSHHCECNDIKRFGEIMEKLIKLYNRRKSDNQSLNSLI